MWWTSTTRTRAVESLELTLHWHDTNTHCHVMNWCPSLPVESHVTICIYNGVWRCVMLELHYNSDIWRVMGTACFATQSFFRFPAALSKLSQSRFKIQPTLDVCLDCQHSWWKCYFVSGVYSCTHSARVHKSWLCKCTELLAEPTRTDCWQATPARHSVLKQGKSGLATANN